MSLKLTLTIITPDANREYMSVSQFKDFQACEACYGEAGRAVGGGKYNALLVGRLCGRAF